MRNLKMLTTSDVGRMFGMSRWIIHKYTQDLNNPLPVHYIGKKPFFLQDEIDDWLEGTKLVVAKK